MNKKPEATPPDDKDPDDRPAPVPTMDEVLWACDTIRAYLQNRPETEATSLWYSTKCMILLAESTLVVIHPISLELQTFLSVCSVCWTSDCDSVCSKRLIVPVCERLLCFDICFVSV